MLGKMGVCAVADGTKEWLEQLGLGQYAAAFSANAIDHHILPELSDSDLKELGVSALGHRKTILKAIAELSATGGETRSPPTEPDPSLAAWERHAGERKPVTMLFADISRSTELTEKLDAEETHELLYGATRRMCYAVETNRGTLCRFMGDGVMAMFGAPVASEHHAVDACEAALEMQQAIQDYGKEIEVRHGVGLQIRVGLHSGEVVVLTVGTGEKVEYDASGPTVPIAARMEQAATSGKIYISNATRRLAAARIDTEVLKPISVKGITGPLPVFALHRVRSAEEARPEGARTLFVGRRAELMQLRGMLAVCIEAGHGQTVYVRGEPGIGKTRLVEEFASLAAEKGVLCHRGLVLPFGVGKGQDAIRSLVFSLLGITPLSSKTERERAAEAALAEGPLHPEQAIFLTDLLDLQLPTKQRALYDAMENARRIEGKQSVASKLLAANSNIQPVLAVIEDVHWADAVTLTHLAVLTETVAACRALLVLTSRIEGDPLDPGWRATTKGSPFSTIDLGPLAKKDAMILISEFTDATNALAKSCLKRAGGNPFFLEQLLRAAQEDSFEKIPDSVQSLVIARMDRLPPRDKRAIQVASVVGQRFALDLVRHLVNDADYRCDRLISNSLVRAEGESYLFAHALIQESVYSSMLKRDRAILHKAAADWFSDHEPVLRAEHLDRAGDPGAAKAYLLAASSQMEVYRFKSALRLAERGFEIAEEPHVRHQLTCLKGELLRDLADIKSSISAYREALENSDDDVQCCHAWMGLAAGLRVTTDYEAALELLDKAEAAATNHNLTAELAQIHHLRGNLYFSLGRSDDCLGQHLLAFSFAEQSKSFEDEADALGGLGDAEYARGRMKTAHDYYTRCIDLSRECGFGRIEVAHLPQLGFSRMYLGDWRGAKDTCLKAVDAAMKVGDRRVEMNARAGLCNSLFDLGEYGQLKEHAEQQMALAKTLGARAWEPHGLMWKGIALQAQGHQSEARELVTQAASIARHAGRAFNAGRVFGALVFVAAEDVSAREAALEEGETVLREGSLSHNHFWFYRFTMDALLSVNDWERAEGYAAALEAYVHAEPLPWTNFFIARGRALAAFVRGDRSNATMGEIQRLRDHAGQLGLKVALPALEKALLAT